MLQLLTGLMRPSVYYFFHRPEISQKSIKRAKILEEAGSMNECTRGKLECNSKEKRDDSEKKHYLEPNGLVLNAI